MSLGELCIPGLEHLCGTMCICHTLDSLWAMTNSQIHTYTHTLSHTGKQTSSFVWAGQIRVWLPRDRAQGEIQHRRGKLKCGLRCVCSCNKVAQLNPRLSSVARSASISLSFLLLLLPLFSQGGHSQVIIRDQLSSSFRDSQWKMTAAAEEL